MNDRATHTLGCAIFIPAQRLANVDVGDLQPISYAVRDAKRQRHILPGVIQAIVIRTVQSRFLLRPDRAEEMVVNRSIHTGASLVIATAAEALDCLSSQASVGGVLIDAEVAVLDILVQALARRGCALYACYGPSSEDLHDAIDDILLGLNSDAVTTWHEPNEPVDEVVNLFLAGRLARENAGALLAVLADRSPLRKALIAHPGVVDCEATP